MDLKNLDMVLKIISNKDIKSYKDFMSLYNCKLEEFKKECFFEPSKEELLWYIFRS